MLGAQKPIYTTPFRMTQANYSLLSKWLEGHVLPEDLLNDLPKLGLMVFHKNTPVGVAFLRVVEGNKGMIDGFLSNPNINLKFRTPCLDLLITDLIALAHHNDLDGVFGLSLNKRVIARAKKLGFNTTPHKVVSMKWAVDGQWGVH